MNDHHAIQAADAAEFLRKSLRANAAFSALSGLAFSLASGPVATFLGNVHPSIVLLVGVQLLFFAGVLVWLSSRSEIPPSLAIGVVVADLLWVVATIIVVYAGLFTRGGEVLAAILAGVVLAMAMLQSIGVRRMGAVRVEVQS
jgi:hypothetical protein